MQYEIMTYKGQTIYYNEDKDKFVCDIEFNNEVKNAKRQSLSDVKKEIDLFAKANLDFKPFVAFYIKYPDHGWMPDKVNVIAIRTDGKFVVKVEGAAYADHVGISEGKLFVYTDAHEAPLKEIDVKIQSLRAESDGIRKGVVESLKPLDVSQYKIAFE